MRHGGAPSDIRKLSAMPFPRVRPVSDTLSYDRRDKCAFRCEPPAPTSISLSCPGIILPRSLQGEIRLSLHRMLRHIRVRHAMALLRSGTLPVDASARGSARPTSLVAESLRPQARSHALVVEPRRNLRDLRRAVPAGRRQPYRRQGGQNFFPARRPPRLFSLSSDTPSVTAVAPTGALHTHIYRSAVCSFRHRMRRATTSSLNPCGSKYALVVIPDTASPVQGDAFMVGGL
jgi:hypothetical protein